MHSQDTRVNRGNSGRRGSTRCLTEIAEALEISVGTVKSRLAYGLAALRKTLTQPGTRESASGA
jgi:hypothetical protein